MKITVKYLKLLNACDYQVFLFEKTFPQGTTITQRSCKKAALAGLNLCWLAAKLFDAHAQKQFDEACATAVNQYDEACASARKQFNEAIALAFYNAWKKDKK